MQPWAEGAKRDKERGPEQQNPGELSQEEMLGGPKTGEDPELPKLVFCVPTLSSVDSMQPGSLEQRKPVTTGEAAAPQVCCAGGRA